MPPKRKLAAALPVPTGMGTGVLPTKPVPLSAVSEGSKVKAAGGNALLVALQPAHLTAHGESVTAADHGHVVIEDVAILRIRRGGGGADAVLRGTNADDRIRAIGIERRQTGDTKSGEPGAGLQRSVEAGVAQEADVEVIQQSGRVGVVVAEANLESRRGVCDGVEKIQTCRSCHWCSRPGRRCPRERACR